MHARKLIQWVPACDTGQHVMHPFETCDEYEEFANHARAWFRRGISTGPRTPMADVPPALRGPNWKA